MKGLSPLYALAVGLAAAGCGGSPPVQTTFDLPYPERNASGDPILAAFNGRTPCDVQGCEKMKVSLVLYGRAQAPSTYWLGILRVGLGNERAVAQGAWTIERGVKDYPSAVVYRLDANAAAGLRSFWRVSDDILLPLDEHARPKPGNGAWGTMLSRDTEPYGPRTYPYDERTGRFLSPGERPSE